MELGPLIADGVVQVSVAFCQNSDGHLEVLVLWSLLEEFPAVLGLADTLLVAVS